MDTRLALSHAISVYTIYGTSVALLVSCPIWLIDIHRTSSHLANTLRRAGFVDVIPIKATVPIGNIIIYASYI